MDIATPSPAPDQPAAPAASLALALAGLLLAMAQACAESGPIGRLLARHLERIAQTLAAPPAPPSAQVQHRETAENTPKAPPARSWLTRLRRRWRAKLNPFAGLRRDSALRAPAGTSQATLARRRRSPIPHHGPRPPMHAPLERRPTPPQFSKPAWPDAPNHAQFVTL